MLRLSSLFLAAALLMLSSTARADRDGPEFRLVYESTDARRTTMKIDGPDRLEDRDAIAVRVSRGKRELFTRGLPVTFDTQPGQRYRVEVFNARRVYFDRTFEALSGTDAVLTVSGPRGRMPRPTPPPVVVVPTPPAPPPPPPPPAPTCIPDAHLSPVLAAVKQENFSDEKLTVLRSAMRDRIVCADQVVRIIGLFKFSSDQLEALRIVGPRLLDRHNAYRIYGAFKFSSDKKKAQKILEG